MSFDEGGRPVELHGEGRSGRLWVRRRVEHGPAGQRIVHLTNRGVARPDRRQIGEEHLTFDGGGRIATAMWHRVGGEEPTLAPDGSYGHERTYDEEGRLAKQVLVDTTGNAMRGADNLTTTTFAYADPAHSTRPTEIRALGPGDIPVAALEGCEVLELAYDASGRPSRTACLTATGEPALLRTTGCAVLTRSTASHVDTYACLDAHGEAAVSRLGWSSLVVERAETGGALRIEHRGLDGELVTDRYGLARQRFERDADGVLIASGPHDDVLGDPVTATSVIANWRRTLVDGLATQRTMLDADGKPSAAQFGWAVEAIAYDEAGESSGVARFDESGDPATDSEGVHRWEWDRDERGSMVAIRSFSVDDKPMVQSGRHEMRYTFDASGLIIDMEWRGVDGEPTGVPRQNKPDPDRMEGGFHRVHITRDPRGNALRTAFYDPDGKLVDSDNGFAAVERDYDGRGRETEMRLLHADGRPANGLEGWATLRKRHFDDPSIPFARRVEYLDARGLPVSPGGSGCATKVLEILATEGPWIHHSGKCYGPAGEPVDGARGAHEARIWQHIDNSINRELRYYDAEGNPTPNKSGIWAMTKEYDRHFRVVRYRVEPVPGETLDGPVEVRITRDRFGRQRVRESFDRAGDLHDGPVPWFGRADHARIETVYDKYGREIEVRWINADGTMGGRGDAAIRRKSYDQRVRVDGKWKPNRVSFHDADGTPMVLSGGYAAYTNLYDSHGRVVHWARYGADGNLVADKNGVAALEQRWNGLGKLVYKRYLGPDGEPIAGPSGCTVIERDYDAQGALESDRCDGEERLEGEGEGEGEGGG